MRRRRLNENPLDDTSGHATAFQNANHVVILVHGIRTMAFWQNTVRTILVDNGFIVELTNYGRFDLLRFLLPVHWLRNKPMMIVGSQVQQVTRHHPDSKISFIAHSFGTRIVAEILRRKAKFHAHRVIFCGSVVPFKYPFEDFDMRFEHPILNDVGNLDILPALAASITWGYGWTGTYGFRRPPFEDRIHDGFGHSNFLEPDFCRDYWVPFLRDGTIVRPAKPPREAVPWLIRVVLLLGRVLKYALCVLLLLLCVTCVLQEKPRRSYIPVEAGSYNYAGPTGLRSAVTAIAGEKCSDWMDWWLVEWLRGRRCVTLARVDNAIDDMIICRMFDHESRDPLDTLERFAEQFPSCLKLDGIKRGRIVMTVPSRVPRLKTAEGRLLRPCDCPPPALKDLIPDIRAAPESGAHRE